MAVRKIRNSWWIDFRHDHIRYRKKSPENSRAGANAYELAVRQRVTNGEPVCDQKKSITVYPPFEEFVRDWFRTYVKINNKASEARSKKYTIESDLIPFFGQTALNEITTHRIEQFKASLVQKGNCNKTVNNKLSVLSKCLHNAADWEQLNQLPKFHKLKIPPAKDNFLTKKECAKLLEELNGVWKEVAFVALRTGMRMGELRALRWQDINWNNRTLTVKYSICSRSQQFVSPKSNRYRCIPIADDLYERLLHRRRCGKDFVFPVGKKHFNDNRMNYELARACESAGLRKVTCHVFRHTFASHLAMAGAPIGAIQQLLGHSSIQTTMRYAHLSQSILKDTIRLLDFKTSDKILGNRWATHDSALGAFEASQIEE